MSGSATSSLIISIIVMLFCCQPLGIVSIVFSALAMAAENSGDLVTADSHLSIANTVNIFAVVLGLAFIGFLCFSGAFTGLLG